MAKRSGQLFRIKKIPVARRTGRVFNSKNRNVDEQDCVSALIKFGYDVRIGIYFCRKMSYTYSIKSWS